jgi:hypothetical protein
MSRIIEYVGLDGVTWTRIDLHAPGTRTWLLYQQPYWPVYSQPDYGLVQIWLYWTPERPNGHWIEETWNFEVSDPEEDLQPMREVDVRRFREVTEEYALGKLNEHGADTSWLVNAPDIPRVIRSNAERNKWLYGQYVDHPEKTLRAIRTEAKSKGWNLGSDMAVRRGIESHCRTLGIRIPTRKDRRIKQD